MRNRLVMDEERKSEPTPSSSAASTVMATANFNQLPHPDSNKDTFAWTLMKVCAEFYDEYHQDATAHMTNR